MFNTTASAKFLFLFFFPVVLCPRVMKDPPTPVTFGITLGSVLSRPLAVISADVNDHIAIIH